MRHDDLDRFDDADRDVTEEVREVAIRIGPWLFSLGVHIVVVIVALLIVWTTITRSEQSQDPRSTTITLSERDGLALKVDAERELDKPRHERRLTRDYAARLRQPVVEVANQKIEPLSPGVGMPAPDMWRPAATGAQEGDIFGSRMGKGGGDDGVGGGPTPRARSIVYVIDASGSLFDTFPYVTRELATALSTRLAPDQRFSILFFRDGEVIEAPVCKGMCHATPDNVRAAIEWFAPQSGHITPHGRTEPDQALQRAFGYQPDLIYLLSDNITGSLDKGLDPDQLLAFIREHNRSGARINTIQYIYPDPRADLGLQPTLEMVAEQSGGSYIMVAESRLQGR